MWLGKDLVSRGVVVHVHGDPHHTHALVFDIVNDGVSRHRSFDPSPESCDDAHAVVGLAIALAIDAERTQQLLQDAQPPAERLRHFSLSAASSYDVLPGAALGVQLGSELGLAPWLGVRTELLSHYSWQNTIAGSRGRFDALLLAAAVRVCAGGHPDARLRLALCVGPASGAVHAWGSGYAPSSAATGFWLAIVSGVRIEALLGLRFVLDLDVISAVYAPSFSAQQSRGGELTRRADATGFALSLGPAFAF
jgi:hypothetical protein